MGHPQKIFWTPSNCDKTQSVTKLKKIYYDKRKELKEPKKTKIVTKLKQQQNSNAQIATKNITKSNGEQNKT